MTRLHWAAGWLGGMLLACAAGGCDAQRLPPRAAAENRAAPGAAQAGETFGGSKITDVAAAPAGSDGNSAGNAQPASASAPTAAGKKSDTADSQPVATAGQRSADVQPTAARATPRTAAGTQEVTFDTIKLPLEKDQPFSRSVLTQSVLDLDGKEIRIRGFILPTSVFRQTGIRQFVLVRDNQQCCFGPGAALHDCIVVEMRPGRTADYSIRPVSVEGKFTLAEMINPDDGRHLAIYHLDGEKVQ